MASNPFATLAQVFYEPARAFADIKERPQVWLPLLLSIGLMVLVLFWYFSTVDGDWMLNHMLASKPDMTGDQRAAMQKIMNPGTMKWMTVGGTFITIPVSYAVYALYYLMAGKMLGSDIGYGKWFAFSAWVSVPRLLVLPLMAVQIATSHGQVGLEELNMLNINYLLLHLAPDSHWLGLANQIDLSSLWVMAVSTIGLRVWTGRSTASCAIASVFPFVFVYGLWAVKIMVMG